MRDAAHGEAANSAEASVEHTQPRSKPRAAEGPRWIQAGVPAARRNGAECVPVSPRFRAVGARVVKSTLGVKGRARQALAARGLLDALGQRVRARRRQPGRSLRSAGPVAETYGFEAPLELARQEANRLRTERLEAGALESAPVD